MSERYRITIDYSNDSITFETKTRVGNVAELEEELKHHTDWKSLVEVAHERSKEVRDESILHPHFKALEEAIDNLSNKCPKCNAGTQNTIMEGQYLIPPSDKDGIITACTKCDWMKVDRL
jgi:hypothetical protein